MIHRQLHKLKTVYLRHIPYPNSSSSKIAWLIHYHFAAKVLLLSKSITILAGVERSSETATKINSLYEYERLPKYSLEFTGLFYPMRKYDLTEQGKKAHLLELKFRAALRQSKCFIYDHPAFYLEQHYKDVGLTLQKRVNIILLYIYLLNKI